MTHSTPLRATAALAWSAACLLMLTPLLIAADSGGVLPWTQWAAAITALMAFGLAAPHILLRKQMGTWRAHMLAILLLIMGGYSFLQTAPLPHSLVAALAPGSAEAYTAWLSPLERVDEDAQLLAATPLRLTVDASLTRSACWLTLVLAGFALLASVLLTDRRHLQLLLVALAAAGALQATFGLYQFSVAAETTVWGVRSYLGGKPFGSFINRSNAAVMLNLGLAGSLGLVAWRLAALTGTRLNGARLPVSELLDVTFDRLSLLALATASLSLVGLLTCGSRSGLAGLVGGLMLALGIVQPVRKVKSLIVTAVGIGILVAISMVQLDLSALSAQRLSDTAEGIAESRFQEARWDHWCDGWNAALHQPLVGWGWGAYRYAYLPFQTRSPGSWFVNADNLWLEVFVETGLLGLTVVGCGLVVIIRALVQLGSSVDPIDHGLVIAGWFALGALASSQFFDFGLRIPANAILAGILFSTVIARRYCVALAQPSDRPATQFRVDPRFYQHPRGAAPPASRRSLAVPLLQVSGVIALAFAAHALAWEARGDKLIRESRLLAADGDGDLRAAETLSAALRQHLRAGTNHREAFHELARTDFAIARLQAAHQATLSTPDLTREQALRVFSRSQLRKIWYQGLQSRGEQDSDVDQAALWLDQQVELRQAVLQARRHAVNALLVSPLSPEVRFTLLTLDFAGGNTEQSAALLRQGAQLRKQNAASLLYAGDLAADAEDWEFAASSWQRAIYLQAGYASRVLQRLRLNTPLRPNDVVPDLLGPLTMVASIELKKPTADTALLARAAGALQRSTSEDRAAQADQFRLLARIQRKLGQSAEATRTLQQAIVLGPRRADLRLEYIAALIHEGRLSEAATEARTGQELTPDDPRFAQLIQKISKQLDTRRK